MRRLAQRQCHARRLGRGAWRGRCDGPRAASSNRSPDPFQPAFCEERPRSQSSPLRGMERPTRAPQRPRLARTFSTPVRPRPASVVTRPARRLWALSRPSASARAKGVCPSEGRRAGGSGSSRRTCGRGFAAERGSPGSRYRTEGEEEDVLLSYTPVSSRLWMNAERLAAWASALGSKNGRATATAELVEDDEQRSAMRWATEPGREVVLPVEYFTRVPGSERDDSTRCSVGGGGCLLASPGVAPTRADGWALTPL